MNKKTIPKSDLFRQIGFAKSRYQHMTILGLKNHKAHELEKTESSNREIVLIAIDELITQKTEHLNSVSHE